MTNVLITGAGDGIGRATAIRLHRSGMQVFAGVHRPDQASDLACEEPGLRTLVLDVTDRRSVESAVDEISAEVGDAGLHGVVNNAGIGVPGPLETVDIDDVREQLEVNVVGQVLTTQLALPLVRQARGRLLFVSSIGGKVAFAFAGPYHASKYAIEAIADVWRQELTEDRIDVALIEPGPMRTGIWIKSIERLDHLISDPRPDVDRYRSRLRAFRDSLVAGDEKGSDPTDVAAVVERALTTPHLSTHYPVGVPARVTDVLRTVTPERVWDRLARRVAQ